VPVFNDQPIDRDFIFWEHLENCAVRVGDWKLVVKKVRNKNKHWELYNLAEDRSELNDLGEQYPEKCAAMKKLWFEQAKRTQTIPWPQHPDENKKK
jgi:arylsulfatase A-like enzyme